MDITDVLKSIKFELEKAITTAEFNGKAYSDGNTAKQALIRSQKLINYIHELIKSELISSGVNPKKLFPPPNSSGPEVKIQGLLKAKKQDICIVPKPKNTTSIERILVVNARSQLSSLQKNIDTLHERTFAEALNLHLKYPKMCLGEVYLIPTHEYDDTAMVNNQIRFKKVSQIEHYVQIFQALNMRVDYQGNEYKYERVCLLIVDFRNKIPKLYSDIQELINDGLVGKGTNVNLKNLTIDSFANDLLKAYSQRFDVKELY